ncbi:MAG: DUF935 domain-containing protein [Pseudomonadota bacterium]
MVSIVDQSGNPIQRQVLTEQQTSKITNLQREFALHPGKGLTPARLDEILRSAELGNLKAQAELFMDMEERDAHILAEMSKRKRALLTVDWDIQPPRNTSATERKQAAYAKEMLRDIPNFEDVILDALDAIGHGFACLEIEWAMFGQEWLPGAITHRPQSWFQLDRATRTSLRLRDMTYEGQELIPFGWITHVHKAKSGYISRGGLHRILSWPYLFKNYAVGDLAEFLEIYGLPLRLGKYYPGASEDEKATLLDAVMSIGHDAAGIIPQGMEIDFKEAAKGQSNPYEAMMSWCERSVSKAVLGGTLTTQSDGKSSTNALGKVHNEVRHDLMVSDAIQLGSTFTRDLVYPILALNKGGVEDRRRLPRFVFRVREIEDIAVMADALPKLVSAGMKIPVAWAHEHSGIPMSVDDEEILTVAKPAGQPAPAAATAALKAAMPEDESTSDKLAAQLSVQSASGWNAVLEHVREIVQSATSLEALRDDLLASFGDLPSDDLVKVMSAAFAVAELAGMSDVSDGH